MNETPKPLLFLSHAGCDAAEAAELVRRIEGSPAAQHHGMRVWFDKRDLVPGQPWQQQLERAISTDSTAFAVYIGNSGVINWVDQEVRLALERAVTEPGYSFLPIIAEGSAGSDALPGFVRQYQGIGDALKDPREMEKLIRVALGAATVDRLPLVAQPFLGLRTFRERESHLFFGRERETEELVNALRTETMLMVVGDCGSGKSSVVRAGLVPAYRGGALSDHARLEDEKVWDVILTRPKVDAFESLANDLSDVAQTRNLDLQSRGVIKDWVRTRKPEKVADAIAEVAAPNSQVLLVVDQFEELFTLNKPDAAGDFVTALMRLAADGPRDTVRVVMTMRRDYYNLCSQYPDFFGRVETREGKSKYTIHRMDDESLRACITQPLEMAGAKDIEIFANRVLGDIGDEPSELALLQMALFETWRRRAEFNDDLVVAYLHVGGVSGALANVADQLYESTLDGQEKQEAHRLFLRLCRVGHSGRASKRIAPRDEFSDDGWSLIQRFAGEDLRRLIFVSGEQDKATAELAHDSLITQWPRYQQWLRADAPWKRKHDDLIETTRVWNAHDRDRGFLLTGARLNEAGKLKRSRPDWLSNSEDELIVASQRAVRRARFLQSGSIGLVLALALALFVVLASNWGSVSAFRVIDAETGDPVLRSDLHVSYVLNGNLETGPIQSDRRGFFDLPAGAEITNVTGWNGYDFSDDSLQDALQDGYCVIRLHRDDEFYRLVAPPPPPPISKSEYDEHFDRESPRAPKIPLRCVNKTMYTADVFIHRYFPKGEGPPFGADYSPQQIEPSENDTDEVILWDTFGVAKKGLFYFYGSICGMEAEELTKGYVFRSSHPVLVLTMQGDGADGERLNGRLVHSYEQEENDDPPND